MAGKVAMDYGRKNAGIFCYMKKAGSELPATPPKQSEG
jgi:hypothetical protein